MHGLLFAVNYIFAGGLNKIMIIKHAKRFLILIGALSWLISCNQPQTSSGLTEMQFDVDTALLAKNPVIDSSLGISFYTPNNWVKREIGTLSLPEETLQGQYLVPEHYYMHPSDSSTMLIATLSNLSNEKIAMMRVDFYKIFNSQGIWNDVQHASFSFNGFEADQFIMHNDKLINFKLLLTTAKTVQQDQKISIDYILPRSHYEKNIKSVESSIGSLLLLNQN